MIKTSDSIVANDSLMTTELEGETVLLDVQSGHYFGLNVVGSRIWELARDPRSVQEVIEILQKEFNVSVDQLENDVISFVEGMEQRTLIRVVEQVDS